MPEKKTAVITFRTDAETKATLEKLAVEKEWTVAHLVNNICRQFLVDHNTNSK